MSRALVDLAGQSFGRWTVLYRASLRGAHVTRWLCRCTCGTERAVLGTELRAGRTTQCGCAHPNTRHGHTHFRTGVSRTYRSWAAMKNRVLNSRTPDFRYYGGRGITLCARWHDFGAFLADMGERPAGLTLDRIDNDGPYSPENCRWVDQRTQRRNSRGLRRVILDGCRMLRQDAARQLGVSPATIDRWILTGRTIRLVAGENEGLP